MQPNHGTCQAQKLKKEYKKTIDEKISTYTKALEPNHNKTKEEISKDNEALKQFVTELLVKHGERCVSLDAALEEQNRNQQKYIED